jgi:ketosteroid isomerase-like protein
MKHSLGLFVAVALAVVVLAPPARAADSLQTALTAAYDSQCAAVKTADYTAYSNSMTPDFINVDPTGKTSDRDQTMTQMKAALADIKFTKCAVTFVSAPQETNGSATASVVLSQDGTGGGTTPINVVARETDTWSLVNGAWLLKRTVEAESTVTVAGHVMQHEGSAATPKP